MIRRSVETAVAIAVLACQPGARAQSAAPADLSGENENSLLIVEVTINGDVQAGDATIVRRAVDYLVRPADLAKWRIRGGTADLATIDGQAFTPLPAGIAAAFDEAQQRLILTVPPELFDAQSVSGENAVLKATQGAFAAFLNYDLSLEVGDGAQAAGFFEAGVSDDWGLVATTMAVGQGAGRGGAVRLDSYYIRDDPATLTRLVVGDSVTDAREWSRQVRFGGIRLGTEFGLRPDLITFPTPAFLGRTAVPSSVELLVNDALRFQTQVDQGPFSINQVPLVTGAGDVTLVIRDALGIERRVKTPYYVSSRLLAKGLIAWSAEAGAERRDYGLVSFGYRNPFVAGSWRRGLTDWLTVEGRAEISGVVRMAGGGFGFVVPEIGEFAAAAAASDGNDGRGWLYRLSFSRITPVWNVAISYQKASQDFDQLGISRDEERIRKQFQASAGLSLKTWGNLTLAWTDLEYGDGNRSRVASANYSVGIGNRAYVSLFALRSKFTSQRIDTTLGVGLTIPLGPRTSAYVQADGNNVQGELRHAAPFDGGWGYRLAASHGDSARQQAMAEWRGQSGEASLEVARFGSRESARLIASGGLLVAGGDLHATRRVEGGLGLVEVPGQADVRIYQENRLVGRTNSHGRAIIPDLRPYEANRIALAPGDLPLSARMPEDTMIVVPRFRGAALARFAIEQDHPATVVLTMPDGRAVDAGSTVRASNGETLFVGYGGEVFLQNAADGITLDIETEAGTCRATVALPSPEEVLPRIGPVRCAYQTGTRP